MLYVRLLFFLLTLLPFGWLIFAFSRKHRFASGSIVGMLAVSVVAFFLFASRHHENRYEFLDPSCYRAMARAFTEGSELHPIRDSLASVPPEFRRDFWVRPDLPSLDGAFRFIDPKRALSADASDPEAFRTRPCFLPALPLAASVFGRFYDAFVPLVGSLWLLSLLLFALSPDPEDCDSAPSSRRRFLTALVLFFATFFPSWFLRGLHSDVVASVLVSLGLLVALSKPWRGQYALVGLSLGLSLAYHFTMALYAIPVAAYAILRSGKIRQTLALVLGTLPGIALVVFELHVAGNPYFQGTGFSDLVAAAEKVPVIRMLLVLVAVLGIASLALLACAHTPVVRRWFTSPRISNVLLLIFAAGMVPACALPFFGDRIGVPELAAGIQSVHPVFLALWGLLAFASLFPFFATSASYRAERAAVFLVALVALYGVYLKGAEVPVGVWSYRRLFPAVALLLPLCLRGALLGWSRHPIALPIPALCLASIFLAPLLWVGVHDAGSDALSRCMASHLAHPDRLIFDYRERTTVFRQGTDYPVFGLPRRNAQGLWDRCAEWALSGVETGQTVSLVTSYAPCTLETGVSLQSEEVFRRREEPVDNSVCRIKTKRLFPCAFEYKSIQDTVLWAEPAVPGECHQYKEFDGGPFGIRGPWERHRRGRGYWSNPGCAIVGPVPKPGHSVLVKIEFGLATEPELEENPAIRLIPPSESASAQTIQLPPTNGDRIVSLRFDFEGIPDADLPATGLWSVEGRALFCTLDMQSAKEP